MNKKIIFTIFLIFMLGITMVGQVDAAISYNDDNNMFSFNGLSSWVSSLFKIKSIGGHTLYSSEISDTPTEDSVSSYVEEDSFKPELSSSNSYIKLTPNKGETGSIVVVKGYNFDPTVSSDVKYNILFGNTIVHTFYPYGPNFEEKFMVPNNANTIVNKVMIKEVPTAYDYFTVIPTSEGPQIKTVPSQGYVGDTVELYGKGFMPNEEDIIIRFDDMFIGVTNADDNGEFVWLLEIPMPNADKEFYLIESVDSNGYIVYTQFVILWDEQLTLIATPDEGLVNDVIALEGTGYIPGDNLDIYMIGLTSFSETILIAEVVVNDVGTFDTTFVVPNMTLGTHNILVYGNNMSSMYNVFEEFTILENGTQPDLTLIATPDEGLVNDVIALEGTGYIPGDTLMILFDNEILMTQSMESSGSFDTTFVVPDLAPGTYLINVYGNNMSSMYNVFEEFTILENGTQPVEPVIFVNPTSGYPGDVIDVWGYNFTANTNLTLYLGPEFVVTVMTDDNGIFTGQFTVPSMTAGLYDIMAVGYSATTPFLVLEQSGNDPDLFVNPVQGYADDAIILSGISFGPNETLVIYLGGEVIVMPTTDTNGAFITTFVVPDWAEGDYVITVFSYNVSEDFEILETEEEEEEEETEDDTDDNEGDSIPREHHRYYMEGLTCTESISAGETGMLSFEVVNRGITDEQDMIVAVWCESLGINLIYENIILERLEPNLIQIPIDIPSNVGAGEYSCMIEMYSEIYAYNKQNRVTDSINFVVEGEVMEEVAVVYLADNVEEIQEDSVKSSLLIFALSLGILALIIFFVYKIYAFTRMA